MSDAIKFGTKDRYFSDANEKRIGRVSFFFRMLFIMIMVALLGMAIGLWLINLMGMNALFAGPVTIILLSIILIASVPVLARKRSHDFNNDGRIVSYILLITLVLNFLLNCYALYSTYTGGIMDLLQPNAIIQTASYISMGLGLASLIVLIILLFRPGTSGANNYGELVK